MSADGPFVAFQANFTGGSGIFVYDGTSVLNVMDTTQLLEGKTISSFLFGPDSLSGNYVTFQATFSDATRGVYVAQFTPVPEPGHALVVGVIGLGWLSRRRRS